MSIIDTPEALRGCYPQPLERTLELQAAIDESYRTRLY